VVPLLYFGTVGLVLGAIWLFQAQRPEADATATGHTAMQGEKKGARLWCAAAAGQAGVRQPSVQFTTTR
jgi:hypothetical protein